MGMALALGGHQLMNIPNNQLIVESSTRINVGKEYLWGGRILSPLVVELSDTKNNKNKIHLALDGRRLTMVHATTNQKYWAWQSIH